jgi:hypothetical protein
MVQTTVDKKKTTPPLSTVFPPDLGILMKARLEAGRRNIKLRDISNIMLHDPTLTMEFLQSANSTMFSGAPAIDLDAALIRLGSARVIVELGDMYLRPPIKDEAVAEVFDILRYQSRRVSIVSLIIASALRPQLAMAARIAGLLSEAGHMACLLSLGTTYVEILKQHKRKNLPYRLEKDHKLDLDTIRYKYLKSKGIPDKLMAPFELDPKLKSPGDVDLRYCVRSAMAIVDAYDNGKFESYNPSQPLPSHVELRLLKLTPIQHERLYKILGEYLKKTADQEAPEGASLLINSTEVDDTIDLSDAIDDPLKVPHYPVTTVKPASRAQLEDFFSVCESAMNEEQLKVSALESLSRSGFFTRTAIVRVPSQSNHAQIDQSLGFEPPLGSTIEIADPLSPFNLFRLDIKSFNSKSKATKTPFGTSAFAIGPVALLPNGEKILLYADAAPRAGLNMDCRGAFRLAMNLLVSKFEIFRANEKEAAVMTER